MIWPVASLIVALRLPLTATVETTPSFAALPPKQVHHPADHALDLDLRFLAGFDLGQRRAGQRQHGQRDGARDQQTFHVSSKKAWDGIRPQL